MTTLPDLALLRTDADRSLALRDQVVRVYAASHADLIGNPWFSPSQFWERLENLFAKTRDFELVTGWLGDEVVGYAFGSPRDNEDLWPDIHRRFPHLTPSGPVYIFREFAVHPDHQRHGFGKLIHNKLLENRSEQVAHLLVRPDNEPALAAYTRWGWVKIGTQQPFSDSPVFDALALDLSPQAST